MSDTPSAASGVGRLPPGQGRARTVAQVDRTTRRHAFDAVAERYDRFRPRYPSEAFDEIAGFAGLATGSRVLEIGPGPGLATLEFARRGYDIVGVELGPNLAATARRNLAGYTHVEIVNADFETWPIPEERFHAVVAASAFHWIDPAIRLEKCAAALVTGGALALLGVDHIAGGSEPFFVDVQGCYELWDPGAEEALQLPAAADVEPGFDDLRDSAWFNQVELRRYERDIEYSTADYLDLLMTYSGHLALEETASAGLLDCIGSLIDGRYGGRIVKRDVITLRLALRSEMPGS